MVLETDMGIVFWNQEDTGQYSMKSAYKWLQQKKESWQASDSTSVWAKLWKIKAPPKTINVVWHALANCLPTLVQLQSRGVQVPIECPICHEDSETILHNLVTCPFAHRCWLTLKIVSQGLFSDFASWMVGIFKDTSAQQQAKVVTLYWALWRNLNDLVWNQKSSSVNKTVAAAKQYLTQWSIAQGRSSMALLQPGHEGDGDCIWVSPQQNSVKVSTNVAVFVNKGAAGFGLVARNTEGTLQKQSCMPVQYAQ
ncbi:uncharacterized protein LOC141705752 [Apium graveolens]|uniref:uncharacterized protein LOC141705752 n=1 Tax=Apium graveolens TaxID=4045 RepID=UPI003D79160A